MRSVTMLAVILTALVSAPALAQPRTGPHVQRTSAYTAPSPYEFAFEVGAALPYGDLGDDFTGTLKGLGAGTGYELGARLRYFATSTLAVGPSFHYADFGDWEGVFDDGAAYAIETSIYRFGIDAQKFFGSARSDLRPYLTLGAALIHNRYEDWDQDFGIFQTASTNLAVAGGAGLALGPMELSAVWTYNPAKNRNLPRAPHVTDTSFDWSYLVVRLGFALGGF